MKPTNITDQQIKNLETLGFSPEYPDDNDPGFCQYILRIKHHVLLQGLHLIVDGKTIDVWCTEHKRGVVGGQDVMIACRPHNQVNLITLITQLTK